MKLIPYKKHEIIPKIFPVKSKKIKNSRKNTFFLTKFVPKGTIVNFWI